MANKEFALPTGAKLRITTASFEDAIVLTEKLSSVFKGLPLAKDLLDTDVTIIKDAVISAISSSDIRASVMKCLERATYENVKFTPSLLDDPMIGDRVREDFYTACWYAVEVNCMPFFVKAFSALRERLQIVTATQKP